MLIQLKNIPIWIYATIKKLLPQEIYFKRLEPTSNDLMWFLK